MKRGSGFCSFVFLSFGFWVYFTFLRGVCLPMAYARLPTDEDNLNTTASADGYATDLALPSAAITDVNSLPGVDVPGLVSHSQETHPSNAQIRSNLPYPLTPPQPPYSTLQSSSSPPPFLPPPSPIRRPSFNRAPHIQNPPSTIGSVPPGTLNNPQFRSTSQQPYQPTLPFSQTHARSYYPPNASVNVGSVDATGPGRYNSAPPLPYPAQSYPAQTSSYSQYYGSVPAAQPYRPTSYQQAPYAAPTPYPYPPSYVTSSYPQQYSSPQPDPYASGHAEVPGHASAIPSSQTPYPQPQSQPTTAARPHTTTYTEAVEEPSSDPEAQSISASGSRGTAALRVWVQDGSASNSFLDADALAEYLRLFPGADNDQGCRVFRYGPACATALLMPLFERLDFSRFSQFPYGLSGNFPVADQWGSGSCTCERCCGGQLCGHYMLSKNLRFYLPIESSDPASPSPKVESETGVMSISAGTR